jgi:hypothetical protein
MAVAAPPDTTTSVEGFVKPCTASLKTALITNGALLDRLFGISVRATVGAMSSGESNVILAVAAIAIPSTVALMVLVPSELPLIVAV